MTCFTEMWQNELSPDSLIQRDRFELVTARGSGKKRWTDHCDRTSLHLPPSGSAAAACELIHTMVLDWQAAHRQSFLMSGGFNHSSLSSPLPSFSQYASCRTRNNAELDLLYAKEANSSSPPSPMQLLRSQLDSHSPSPPTYGDETPIHIEEHSDRLRLSLHNRLGCTLCSTWGRPGFKSPCKHVSSTETKVLKVGLTRPDPACTQDELFCT